MPPATNNRFIGTKRLAGNCRVCQLCFETRANVPGFAVKQASHNGFEGLRKRTGITGWPQSTDV